MTPSATPPGDDPRRDPSPRLPRPPRRERPGDRVRLPCPRRSPDRATGQPVTDRPRDPTPGDPPRAAPPHARLHPWRRFPHRDPGH
jgi:hypothetical protein